MSLLFACLWCVPVLGPTLLQWNDEVAMFSVLMGGILPLGVTIHARTYLAAWQVVVCLLASGIMVWGGALGARLLGVPIMGLGVSAVLILVVSVAAYPVSEDYL